ncbi:MAG: DNA-directed RNA polymerase subunit omega [Phycisphaerae bacterium]|nr:DNA-directed RNA polymerase subunit omega [Phycisphaerae bacterium]MCK6466226.1 DNA-directed RNA polymerase subunit omega [Phycisphaerae bacterium]MCL4719943.1 DNA-directed RNA polymerase subunit omega [Phycisphaerae bacterium]NUQ10273.1 DNA-directed RNA polymerase subunit omega [Phycisphaerae bacterium]GIK17474.1 MAG: DNA-directed RNA polymerase subunit omega [Planctomycetota bacterium]
MIELLKSDDIINKCGGRFKLTALIQRRWLQLLQGSRPMVESKGLTPLEVVVREIAEGKIEMELATQDYDYRASAALPEFSSEAE